MQRGWSAIMIATKNEHEDIVRYLVEKGSDLHYKKQVIQTSHRDLASSYRHCPLSAG
jgi:ankyrin repeat protein